MNIELTPEQLQTLTTKAGRDGITVAEMFVIKVEQYCVDAERDNVTALEAQLVAEKALENMIPV